MRVRLFLVASVLALVATSGHAQPIRSEGAFACEDGSGEPLAALEARKQRLEREVARQGESRPTKANTRDQRQAPEQNLRKLQEELLQVLFQIDCRSAQKDPP